MCALSSSKYPIFKGLATLFARWMAHRSHHIGGNCETLTKYHRDIVVPIAIVGQLADTERSQGSGSFVAYVVVREECLSFEDKVISLSDSLRFAREPS